MARFLSLLLTGLLSLAGCGATPAAPPPPTRTLPSTSSTTEPTPTPPPIPQAATHNTRRGAIAFVKHYIELANYAQRTGDTEPLKSVEGPHCVSCRRARRAVAAVADGGGDIRGGEMHLEKASARGTGTQEEWVVLAVLVSTPQVVTNGDGTIERHGRGTTPVTFKLKRSSHSRFVISQWTRNG